MIEIKEIYEASQKSNICNDILRALPSWFGIEEGILGYVKEAAALPFFSAISDNKPVGFVAIKTHSMFTAEVCVMGILKEFQRQGIGRELINICEDYCKRNGMEFLTVKTLDESRESKSYEKTRLFYQAAGFKKIETFPLHWDENNPCLFLAKHIAL